MEEVYFSFYLKKTKKSLLKNKNILKIGLLWWKQNFFSRLKFKKSAEIRKFFYFHSVLFKLKFHKKNKKFKKFFIFDFLNIQTFLFFKTEKKALSFFSFFKKKTKNLKKFFYFSFPSLCKTKLLKIKKLHFLVCSIFLEIQEWFFSNFQNFQTKKSLENFFFSFFQFLKSNLQANTKFLSNSWQKGKSKKLHNKNFKKIKFQLLVENFFFKKQKKSQNFVFNNPFEFNQKGLFGFFMNTFQVKKKKLRSFKVLKYWLALNTFCFPQQSMKKFFRKDRKKQKKTRKITNSKKIFSQFLTAKIFKKQDFLQKFKNSIPYKKIFFNDFFHFFLLLFSPFFFLGGWNNFFQSVPPNLAFSLNIPTLSDTLTKNQKQLEKRQVVATVSKRKGSAVQALKKFVWTRYEICKHRSTQKTSPRYLPRKILLSKDEAERLEKKKHPILENLSLKKEKKLKRNLKKNGNSKTNELIFQKVFHQFKKFPLLNFHSHYKTPIDYFEQRLRQISPFCPQMAIERFGSSTEKLEQKKNVNFLKGWKTHFLRFSKNFQMKNKTILFFKKNCSFFFNFQKNNSAFFLFFCHSFSIQCEKSIFHSFQFLELRQIKKKLLHQFCHFSWNDFFRRKLFSFKFSWRKNVEFLDKQKNILWFSFFYFFEFCWISDLTIFFFSNFSFFETNLQIFFEIFGYYQNSFLKNFFLSLCSESEKLNNQQVRKNSFFQEKLKYFHFSLFQKKISFFSHEKFKKNLWLFSKKSFSIQLKINQKIFSKIFSFQSFFIFFSKYLIKKKFSHSRKKHLFFKNLNFFGYRFKGQKLFPLENQSQFNIFQPASFFQKNEKEEWYLCLFFNIHFFSLSNFYKSAPLLSFSVNTVSESDRTRLDKKKQKRLLLKTPFLKKQSFKVQERLVEVVPNAFSREKAEQTLLANKIFLFHKIPTQKSINLHLEECKNIIQSSKSQTQLSLMRKLQKKIQGWCKNYTFLSTKQIFYYCDSMVLKFLWNWTKKIHAKKSKFWIRQKYFHFLTLSSSFPSSMKKTKKTWFFGKKIGKNFICLPLHSQQKKETLQSFQSFKV